MKNPFFIRQILFSATIACFFALAEEPIVVQDPSVQDRWQLAVNPSEPLVWYWHKATKAKIICSRAGVKPSIHEILRNGDDETSGEFLLPIPKEFASGEEFLFDVVLELFKDEEKIKEESARIACAPTSDSGSIIVRKPETSSWRNITKPKMFEYPDGDAPLMTAVPTSGSPRSRNLAAGGGFDVLAPASDVGVLGLFTFSASGGDEILDALLNYITEATFIMIR